MDVIRQFIPYHAKIMRTVVQYDCIDTVWARCNNSIKSLFYCLIGLVSTDFQIDMLDGSCCLGKWIDNPVNVKTIKCARQILTVLQITNIFGTLNDY